MLYQIVYFLLDVAIGLVVGACLLRVYMQYQRVPFDNPIGHMVFALSNWIVLPVRRVMRPTGRLDLPVLLIAYVLTLCKYLFAWLVVGAGWNAAMPLVMAAFDLLRTTVYGFMGLMLVYVVLSWVQVRPGMGYVVERLCEPPLRPLRRVVPLLNGLDLSPLVLMVALQVVLMVLDRLQALALAAAYMPSAS
jgi:YggT family protein